MRIAILTPLFPPDVGDPAPYVKLLAEKLSVTKHTVTVQMYGRLPERVSNVKLQTTDKRLWVLLRIFLFTLKLIVTQHRYDRFIIQNGPSTELPALALFLLRGKSIILVLSDERAHAQAHTGLYKYVHAISTRRAATIIDVTTTPERHQPERHPFAPFTPEILSAHENWWHAHITDLLKTSL